MSVHLGHDAIDWALDVYSQISHVGGAGPDDATVGADRIERKALLTILVEAAEHRRRGSDRGRSSWQGGVKVCRWRTC